MARLSLGELKFGRFVMLNISVRNCALKSSDIFVIGMFLNREKSNQSVRANRIVAPELPSWVLMAGAVKHCSLM